MDVDSENKGDRDFPDQAAAKRPWAEPKLVALSLSRTSGGDTPLDIEIEFLIFSFNDCGPFGSNCS